MIPFNKAVYLPSAFGYVADVIKLGKIAGDGEYTKLCSEWMEKKFSAKKVLLTTSCTAALEMTALLLDIKQGDEVIMPSYTFVSTASAFVIHGATPVFVDIRKDTMNIDETKIEEAITSRTKAIVVVHYAGVGCNMDKILSIAKKHNLPVIEDAAQGFMATYKDKYLGTLGDFGCYSFHETKNYTMGEGGALVINNEKYIERAEIIREKGTNRSKFFRGEVDKYTWVDLGSSFLPSEFNVSYLYGQLEVAEQINENRLATWKKYEQLFRRYTKNDLVDLPTIPKECNHNAHMFYVKFSELSSRTNFIRCMKEKGVGCTFHYVPLHSAKAGLKYGRFSGNDVYTTQESERLVRLPMFYNLTKSEFDQIAEAVQNYLNSFL